KQGVVKKFYTLAVKDEKKDIISARMGPKKVVKITPDLIAEFLKFERPTSEEVEYPHPSHKPKSRKEAMEIIYTEPVPPKDDGSTFPIGY
ncbi:hypothetical protein KJJ93_28890, partial [Escherichia coli]|uniref:hypothetical protein n=1 Tax=Escherichia coli TaxID=562 RepID=UPI001BD9C295